MFILSLQRRHGNFTMELFLSCIIGILILFVSGQCAQAGSSASVDSVEQKFEIASGYERNRTMGDRWILWGLYQLETDSKFHLQTGASYNATSGAVNALFIEVGYEHLKDSRYSARVKFLGNQYSEYNRAANSIIPYMHWENSNYYIDAGYNYRFLNTNTSQLWNIFYYQTNQYSVIPYYQFGARYHLKDGLSTFGMAFRNFDEMYAGNLGAYHLLFNYRRSLNDTVTIFGNLAFWQSGGLAMANTYYKTTLYGGIEVKL